MRILGFLLGFLLVGAVSLGLGLRPPALTSGASASDAEPILPVTEEATSASGASTASLHPVVPPDPAASALPTLEAGHGTEVPESAAEAGAGAADTAPAVVQDGLLPDSPSAERASVATPIAQEGGVGDWQAFFTSFRSQASADGFARFLRTATGRDFRVDRAGPGDYRVWLLIEPGESRRERIDEIEAVTGMTLGGGDL